MGEHPVPRHLAGGRPDDAAPSSLEKKYLVEMMGGGIALFDCDNDGKLDIVVTNDSSVDRYRKGGDLMVTLVQAGLCASLF